MELTRETLAGRDIAGALSWWREAGVDLGFADGPRAWIETDETEKADAPTHAIPPQTPASASKIRIGGDSANLPATLEQFSTWWLSEPSLDNGLIHGRIPPRGNANAEVMLLVAHPEAEDSEHLLAGPQGKLLDQMVNAMGLPVEQVYFASILPRHTPHPDWAALERDGIGEVLARHIALAAPRRLIAFGGNILPLLGHDPTKSGQNLREFNHEGRSIPLLPAMELGVMLGNARRKASFWQRWLDWTG